MSLPGDSDWWINLGCEAWLLVIGGSLRIGDAEAGMGEAIYLDEDHAKLEVGSSGLRALLAYALPAPIADLLERPDRAFARPALPIPSDGIADRKSPAGSAQAIVMTPLARLAFIGNSLPRRCGIATFTTDLQQAVAASDRERWKPASWR